MIAQQMREQYEQIKQSRSRQNSLSATPRNLTLRQSFHQPSQSNVQYQDYLLTRKESSKSVLLCCNCINLDKIAAKEREDKIRSKQDKEFYQNLNKSMERLLNEEMNEKAKKRELQKQLLLNNYHDYLRCKEVKKQQDSEELRQYTNQVLKKDEMDRDLIKNEIRESINKKKQLMKGLEEQLQVKQQMKRAHTEVSCDKPFEIGNFELHSKNAQQRREAERVWLKQERDEQIRQKQLKIQEYERYQRDLEKRIADEVAREEQKIKQDEAKRKEQQKKEYSLFLNQMIQSQRSKQLIEKQREAFRQQKSMEKLNQENSREAQLKKSARAKKKEELFVGLTKQIEENRKLRTQEAEKEMEVDRSLRESNAKYEYLRKELKQPVVKNCGKCCRQYEQKLLTKIARI